MASWLLVKPFRKPGRLLSSVLSSTSISAQLYINMLSILGCTFARISRAVMLSWPLC